MINIKRRGFCSRLGRNVKNCVRNTYITTRRNNVNVGGKNAPGFPAFAVCRGISFGVPGPTIGAFIRKLSSLMPPVSFLLLPVNILLFYELNFPHSLRLALSRT